MSKLKSIYATKKELEVLRQRIQKMYGINMTLSSLKGNIQKLLIDNRVLRNEIKALNKRIDKLNKDRGLSGMKL